MSETKYKQTPLSIDVIVSLSKDNNAKPSFEVRGHRLGHFYDITGEQFDTIINYFKNHQVNFDLNVDEGLSIPYGLQDVTSKTIKGGITRTKYNYKTEIDRGLLNKYSRRDRQNLFKILYPQGTHAKN